MVPPPSSLLRDLLAADGFKNRRRSKPPDSSAAPASRAVSMPLNHQYRAPGKPARSQSDVLTRSRLRNGGVIDGSDDAGSGDAGAGDDRRRASTAMGRRSSGSMKSARSYRNSKQGNDDSGGSGDGGAAARRGGGSAAAIPALDESALNALISMAAGSAEPFLDDEEFRASLRAGCASCLGESSSSNSNHRAVLDLRVVAQTVERAAKEDDFDPRDLKRASAKLHQMASLLGTDEADAIAAATDVPYQRLAACAHVYMSAVSKLQRRDHSAAVHALEAFCLAPREARTALLPALWDRLFRPGLSHLRTWRDRESAAAASSDEERIKEVEKTFADMLDEGTRVFACYYRDWLLGRTDAMALPDVPAPPTTAAVHVHAKKGFIRLSTSTSYDVGSDVVFSSGSTTRRSVDAEEEEEEEVRVETARAADSVAKSSSPTTRVSEENMTVLPNGTSKLVDDTSESQDEGASTSYHHHLIPDISAIELLTLEFCDGPLQSGTTDGNNRFSVFATIPSDFLCPLTRQVFNRPVTIETGQTFERHAIVQWLNRGFRSCPVTGQELEILSIPDTNRVLRRLIDSWKSEHCTNLVSELSRAGVQRKLLTLAVIDKVFSSARTVSEKLRRARHLMAIGGIDFLLRKFHEGGGDEKVRTAEHLLLCIRAEGSCRNYVAVKISSSSVLQVLRGEALSARRAAVGLFTELLCLRRREVVESLLSGLATELIVEAMNVLLEHLRGLPVEEQVPVAVLLLHFDALVEKNHSSSTYREEAVKTITHSLRCCVSDSTVAPSTRKALLMLGGQFSFSGEPIAEAWMLREAGFVDDSRRTAIDPDAVVVQQQEKEHEAWLGKLTLALLGGSARRPFLDALSNCLGSADDADLAGACLTTAGWLTRSLVDRDDAADAQLAAFSAVVPRLKQCLAPARPARHRVLAAASLHNFSRIPDCRALLVLLGDGLRDRLAELAGLTWTARQLSAQLHE